MLYTVSITNSDIAKMPNVDTSIEYYVTEWDTANNKVTIFVTSNPNNIAIEEI